MAQVLANQGLPRWLLLQAGGSLQHASTLLALVSGSGSLSALSSINSSSSSSRHVLSQEAGRSISTTRGIYMGRVFLRENLQRHPPQSPLFTRDNYQYLENNGWSLAACEQVLHKHHGAQGYKGAPAIYKQLVENIAAAQSLEQLQVLVNRHAHQMNASLFAKVIQKAPNVVLRPNGSPDYQAAALLLETVGRHLQPLAANLSAGSISYSLASYVKCKAAPPADLLHELLQAMLLNNAEKLQQCNAHQLAQLLLSLSKLVQPQANWPLMKAVLQHATTLLTPEMQPNQQQQQQGQQLGAPGSSQGSSDTAVPPSSSSSSSSTEGQAAPAAAWKGAAAASTASSSQPGLRPPREDRYVSPTGRYAREQYKPHFKELTAAQVAAKERKDLGSYVNSTALTALLLDRANTYSPQYLRLLYQWLENTDRLSVLYPNAASQFWTAMKSQWSKFEARNSANSATAAGSSEAGEAGDSAEAAAAADADLAPVEPDDMHLSTARLSVEQYQQKVEAFFGKKALQSLAQATAPLVTSMTENNLGQLFNAMGRLRWASPELLAAASGAFKALCAAQTPTVVTKANAAWAAGQLQHYDPALILPAVLTAVQAPESLDGFLAARIMIATSQMPQEVLQQLQLLLKQELHRLSGARGPPPAAAAAAAVADPATAAAGQIPDWVASLAGCLAGRMPELRPREVAYILLSYSQLPGVPVHEELFGAAAGHIAAHADTFVQLDDMEMVATAFERFNFKDGLPALKALQEQSEKLLSAQE